MRVSRIICKVSDLKTTENLSAKMFNKLVTYLQSNYSNGIISQYGQRCDATVFVRINSWKQNLSSLPCRPDCLPENILTNAVTARNYENCGIHFKCPRKTERTTPEDYGEMKDGAHTHFPNKYVPAEYQ